jgi:hypothetical protein
MSAFLGTSRTRIRGKRSGMVNSNSIRRQRIYTNAWVETGRALSRRSHPQLTITSWVAGDLYLPIQTTRILSALYRKVMLGTFHSENNASAYTRMNETRVLT